MRLCWWWCYHKVNFSSLTKNEILVKFQTYVMWSKLATPDIDKKTKSIHDWCCRVKQQQIEVIIATFFSVLDYLFTKYLMIGYIIGLWRSCQAPIVLFADSGLMLIDISEITCTLKHICFEILVSLWKQSWCKGNNI